MNNEQMMKDHLNASALNREEYQQPVGCARNEPHQRRTDMAMTDEQVDEMCSKLRIAFGVTTTDDLVREMVNRFLCWKLPADFSPDAGISFKAEYNEDTPYPMRNEPIGTNLFNAEQATEMVMHMLRLPKTPFDDAS